MNSRETAYLILRIFALYIIIINLYTPLSFLPIFATNTSQFSNPISPLSYIFIFISLAPFALGVYLWISAKKLCSLFILEPDTSLINESNYSLNILKLAIILLGIYLIATSIPAIMQAIVTFSSTAEEIRNQPAYADGFQKGLTFRGFSLVMGLAMVLWNNADSIGKCNFDKSLKESAAVADLVFSNTTYQRTRHELHAANPRATLSDWCAYESRSLPS